MSISDERELTPVEREAVKHFRAAARNARRAIEVLQREHPEANLYFNEDKWYLLIGPSHDETRDLGSSALSGVVPNRERELVGSEVVQHSGGATCRY